VGSREFSARLLPLSETMLFGSQPFLEDATAFALKNDFAECQAMREAYVRRARVLLEALSNAPGIRVRMPEAGMFLMADVRATRLSGDDFAFGLLEEESVVTMPGESFGAAAKGHIRISLTADEAVMAEAGRRIARFAGKLMTAFPRAAASSSVFLGLEPRNQGPQSAAVGHRHAGSSGQARGKQKTI
jgi:arginine:pyruvate transaminase